jgi:hypothetical protein
MKQYNNVNVYSTREKANKENQSIESNRFTMRQNMLNKKGSFYGGSFVHTSTERS